MAEENGIVKGYGDGTFKPDNNISREEMATVIDRYISSKKFNVKGKEVEAFKDEDSVSKWAENSVDRIHKLEIIEGKGGGMFDPKANSTRAEVAKVLMRLIEKVVREN